MSKNKWLTDLRKMEGVVDFDYDAFASENCLYSPSPYLNWVTASKSNGFPKNSSALFFSEPKSGKSLLCYALIAEMQRTDPEGIAVYVNSEHRGSLQAVNFPGLDRERTLVIDSNDPVEIFDDLLDGSLKAKVQDGMPLKMIIVDSITNIMGIKRKHADSIEQHLIGDQALTVGNALANLVPWCKRNKIFLMGTAQIRANIDSNPYAEKTKLAASFAVKHAFEYFISVKRAGSAEDKADIEGSTFEDGELTDARGKGLLTGHKIYVKCEANSVGPAGRAGVFTLDYKRGIVNQNEEIFFLGKNTGIIGTRGNRYYNFGGTEWGSKAECALAIRDNPELGRNILEAVRKLDDK